MPFATILCFVLLLDHVISTVAVSSEHHSTNGRPLLLLLRGRNKEIPSPSLKGKEKEAAAIAVAEIPPKPLPQIMLPRNMTADALKPPLGAAQVAPPPRRLVDVDVCRGYYDVMGQFDHTFNCTKGTYIYCCGTCHYRFCCEHQRNRLNQDTCTNYNSPVWANTQVPATQPPSRSDPDFDPLQQQSNNTVYVIGGVISFTLVVAIGVKVAFRKVSRRPRNRDLNMPRSLVDILRHQSSPVQQSERNNSTIITTSKSALGRQSKNHYIPVLQSKDNRIGKHNLIQSVPSPKHTATIERVPRMNNTQLTSPGPLISSKTNNMYHPLSFSHSFHNLAQLPPAYEAVMKPDINRYSSLKRLEKDLDDYTSYYTSKKRPNEAPLSFHSSQHHLPWGADYTLGGARGTLPLHTSRPQLHVPTSTPTPNPYPLPQSPYSPTFETLSQPPRRVMSQDQLLALGEGNTLSYLSKNQQHQYYKAMATSRSSNSKTLRKSHERLLLSPQDMIMGGDYGGMMPHLSYHKKTQSQQNVCVTPSLDRHHMIKMNSHPTSSCEQEYTSIAMKAGHGTGTLGWGDGHGLASGAGGTNARRMAFTAKRQNTIEQLHFLPGAGGGSQALWTGSKNEVTV